MQIIIEGIFAYSSSQPQPTFRFNTIIKELFVNDFDLIAANSEKH